jgi:hypothetical protein
MKIVIDVDKLLQERRITSEEYTRLKSLAAAPELGGRQLVT